MFVLHKHFALCILTISLLSCGSQPDHSSGHGSIVVHAIWPQNVKESKAQAIRRAAPAGVATMRMIVSGADMSDMQAEFTASAGTGAISGVPAGSSRVVTLKGLNSGGTVIYYGKSNTVTVTDGGTATTNPIVMAAGDGSVMPADTIAPSIPTGLSAIAASTIQINLTWTASTDNVNVTGYRIYRDGVYLALVTSGTSTSDSNLTPSTNYCYTVSAVDVAINESAQSTQSCATTLAVIAYTTGINYNIPDTGQTTVYTAGDDGSYLINSPSYTDNGNGTITDNVTGLVWQKQDDATNRIWDAANTYCTNLVLAGPGWRLPTDFELMTIVDYGKYLPTINTAYFSNTQSNNYWSSTIDGTPSAWYVDFGYGYPNKSGKNGGYFVRCVR